MRLDTYTVVNYRLLKKLSDTIVTRLTGGKNQRGRKRLFVGDKRLSWPCVSLEKNYNCE